MKISVVIPVKDGSRYLQEVLTALEREQPDEILVIDSGSSDRSLQIAQAAGVSLIEIAPSDFGHGRTRNLAAERTVGDLICFLTQDATPLPGWLNAYRSAFDIAGDIGAAYGPHLPRPDTSPMIARELEDYFKSFAADSTLTVQDSAGPSFLSNVNACYLRSCWEQIRFRDIGYAEDQAFGTDMLAAGWRKVYQAQAAVLHAHDYGTIDFMRRYFDEYRGLRESTGHIERLTPDKLAREVFHELSADQHWMSHRRFAPAARARWAARGAVHHSGRRVFSALGSRSVELPRPVQRALSLESRTNDAVNPTTVPADTLFGEQAPMPSIPEPQTMPRMLRVDDYAVVTEVWRNGPTPLAAAVPGMSERKRLRLALIIPPFSRGSGGHNTLYQIISRLEQRGHTCSIWLADYHNQERESWPARLRAEAREYFAPLNAPFYKGFQDWQGTDLAIATGWQTVHAALSLPLCRARAYLVNDHEPEFYSTSIERIMAEDTYRHSLHCIAASPWLRDLLIARYGASADSFELGVEHSIYRPLDVKRRGDTVIYYARHSTARRAVPMGVMALSELYRRNPDIRIVLFGDNTPLYAAFPYEHHGVLTPSQLALLYSESTAGLCLSLTNFSLMPKEMLACGLPCVELAGVSAESIFGQNGPLALADFTPDSIADQLEQLVSDADYRGRISRTGVDFVQSHTWDRATDEVELGLRHALREREQAYVGV